jgi:hypothetical protein
MSSEVGLPSPTPRLRPTLRPSQADPNIRPTRPTRASSGNQAVLVVVARRRVPRAAERLKLTDSPVVYADRAAPRSSHGETNRRRRPPPVASYAITFPLD